MIKPQRLAMVWYQLCLLSHWEVQLLWCMWKGLETSDLKMTTEEIDNLRISESDRTGCVAGGGELGKMLPWASVNLLWEQTRSWYLLPGVVIRRRINSFLDTLSIVAVFHLHVCGPFLMTGAWFWGRVKRQGTLRHARKGKLPIVSGPSLPVQLMVSGNW